MDSRISSAVLVQANGRGFSFQVSIQARMSALSWRTERRAPQRELLGLSSANQRSTRFSQELDVGVKCRTNRGCAVSHVWIAGVLWVLLLSSTTWTSSSARDRAVECVQELLELDRPVAAVQAADHLAGGEVQRGVAAG